MVRIRTVVGRPDPEVEAKSRQSNDCYRRKVTYQECIERGLDPAKYGLTPDSIPEEPQLVDSSLNKVNIYDPQFILPNRPPRNRRKDKPKKKTKQK